MLSCWIGAILVWRWITFHYDSAPYTINTWHALNNYTFIQLSGQYIRYDVWQTLRFELFCCRDLLGSKGYRPSALVTGLCFDILKASRLGMALQGRLTHVTADQDGWYPTGRAWGLSTQLHTASCKDICEEYVCKHWFWSFFGFLGFFVHVARRYFGRGRWYFGRGRRYLAGVDGILASSRFSRSRDILV